MERWQLNACVEGYEDRQLDQEALCVSTGYWSAYYNNSKHPKTPDKIIANMYKQQDRTKAKGKPDLDVDSFLMREREFKRRQALMEN